MNLYLVSRVHDDADYDDVREFVVSAECEDDARRFYPDPCPWGRSTWSENSGGWVKGWEETKAEFLGVAAPGMRAGRMICVDVIES